MTSPLKINGNGIANATGKQLLQIIPINIITVIIVIGSAVGLYYKTTGNFEARLSALEKSPLGMSVEEKRSLMDRVSESERELKDLSPKIIETHTNVLWLMNQQKSANSR